MLAVADAGLPIPTETERIDLALTRDIPRVIETLCVILEEMQVEQATLAEEARTSNLQFVEGVLALLPGVSLEFVPHSELKSLTRQGRAVVRTGEFAPMPM